MSADPSVLQTIITTSASGVFVLAGAAATALFTKQRDHESTWRQAKMDRYQEYMAALSAIVEGRDTPRSAHDRYADAINALSLVASPTVLDALEAYLRETSYKNPDKVHKQHDALLSALIRAMRDDVQPNSTEESSPRSFRLIAPPPPTE